MNSLGGSMARKLMYIMKGIWKIIGICKSSWNEIDNKWNICLKINEKIMEIGFACRVTQLVCIVITITLREKNYTISIVSSKTN